MPEYNGATVIDYSTLKPVGDLPRNQVVPKVSQTAGRTITLWDNVNNREQLTYADTGWRVVNSDVMNGWVVNQYIAIRRIGSTVYLNINDITGTAATSIEIYTLPTGFGALNQPGYMRGFVSTLNDPPAMRRISISNLSPAIISSPGAFATATNLYGTMHWTTLDAWPTTLPGNAFGSIPNA